MGNPGAVETDLPRHHLEYLPAWFHPIFKGTYALFANLGAVWDAETAALTQLWAATAPAVAADATGIGGSYLVPLARVGEPPVQATNVTLCKELYAFTERLIFEASKSFSTLP